MIPGTTPTHPLFPPDQVFLWLPGLASNRFAFCTGNQVLESAHAPELDSEIAWSPPFPVSPATFIAWDTQTSPPCPYHPIPVLRAISPAEMDALALRVIQPAGEEETNYPQPHHILRNEKKCLIIRALAEVGNLCGNVPPPALTHDAGE